jgi:pimeloyl-ACP methyl ester carboxylesterase
LFAQSDRAHADRLKDLLLPVFFMTGEHDANSEPTMSQAMARLAPGSCVEVLSGARHMMTLTHADEVNSRLVHFLNKSSSSL